MTLNATPGDRQLALAPLDEKADHLRGAPAGASRTVLDRIRRDAGSGLASGQVLRTPTLFIDGVVHRGGYDPPALLAALAP